MNWKIERKQCVVVVFSALLASASYLTLPEQPLRRSVTGARSGPVAPAQSVAPRNLVIEPRLLTLPPLLTAPPLPTAAEPLPAVKPATAVTRQPAIGLPTGPAKPSRQAPPAAPVTERLSARDFLHDATRSDGADVPLSAVSQNSQFPQNGIPSQ